MARESLDATERKSRHDKSSRLPAVAVAGVTKKKTPTKKMSRAQRQRHENRLERAGVNVAKLDKKVQNSFEKAKKIKQRSVSLFSKTGADLD